MSRINSALEADQILDAILRDSPDEQGSLADLTPEVLAGTREAYDALYRREQPVPLPVLHALAAVVADWQGSGPLADWHRAKGADPRITAADPIRSEVHGLSAATVQALRDHVDGLSLSPALTTARDHERLAAAGVGAPVVVLVSRLVAFETHLQRLVTDVAARRGKPVPAADAPTRPSLTRTPIDAAA
ncbi:MULTISPECIES: hypothetical protein [unclassified Brachybacterium]|uniref:hypothetical protein n=1 Tax=unclassified Brachybacterium TaxID=2623841 RepID=UPI00361C7F08